MIADDHALVRDAIASFLESEADMTVHAAATLDEALAAIRMEAPFDVVLLDYAMPGMLGLTQLPAVIEANGGRPVAIISGLASREVAEEALAAGAAGFVPKTLPARSMANAVRFMASGEQYAPVGWMTEAGREDDNPLLAQLTQRERQVLTALCDGRSNKEIARDLDLQEVTVKLHVKTLCRKLNARNRTHAAMIAKDNGLI